MDFDNGILSTLPITPEVNSLIIQCEKIESKISENHSIASINSKFILCPICQEGNLNPYEHGKILGIFPDIWLICSKCAAEFDKKLSKAKLVKVKKDPYGIFKLYALQTLPLSKWQDIALQRIKDENNDLSAELSTLKNKLIHFINNELNEGKIRAIGIDINSFILKKDESPLFATGASILVERTGRITERTTIGGGRRNYSGFSFRVAKGLYYHSGSSSASPRQTIVQTSDYTELVNTGIGGFLVTNQRLLFKGKSRGLVIPINKIVGIDIDNENDTLLIIQENKKPTILKLAIDYNVQLSNIKLKFQISLDYIVSLINPTHNEQ
jgi:hypothetical protein